MIWSTIYLLLQTSLSMPGFSVTLLLLPAPDEGNTPDLNLVLSLLDEKPQVPGWKWGSGESPVPYSKQDIDTPSGQDEGARGDIRHIAVPNPQAFVENIKRAAHAIIKAEPEITKMDSIAGDGDCGLTLKVRLCESCFMSNFINRRYRPSPERLALKVWAHFYPFCTHSMCNDKED